MFLQKNTSIRLKTIKRILHVSKGSTHPPMPTPIPELGKGRVGMVMVSLKSPRDLFSPQRLARSILHSLLSRRSEPKVPYRVNAHRRAEVDVKHNILQLRVATLFGGCKNIATNIPEIWWFFHGDSQW